MNEKYHAEKPAKIYPDDSASQADYNSMRNSREFGLKSSNQMRDFRTSSLPQINE